jgi:bla regulator protein BlaR1
MSLTDLAPLANHLWQSTLCICVAWLLTRALRRNAAAVRYWLWLAASLKFLIPFSLLIGVGSQVAWQTAQAIKQRQWSFVTEIGQPFAPSARLSQSVLPPTASPVPAVLFCVWLIGFGAGVWSWSRRWQRVRTAVRASTPLHLALPIPTLSCPTRLEPGVFGIVRPMLLLPEGITYRLSAVQLEALIAHELCHAWRRDNLAAAIHMMVEAIFWFHPLVWWIESKLIEERERACDEGVLRFGSEPEVYAESILNACKLYLESPLPCVSTVSGGQLRQRIDRIMANQIAHQLDFGHKFLLVAAATAAIVGPVILGLATRPTYAQSGPDTPGRLAFEVASIKPSKNTANGNVTEIAPGGQRFTATDAPLKLLIMTAYDVNVRQISGGPGWLNSEFYDVEAKAERPASRRQIHLMLQSLLADRFNLMLHRETKELPMYLLTAETHQSKVRENRSGGEPHVRRGSSGQTVFENVPISQLVWFLSLRLRRDVLDKTGLKGNYDFELAWTPDVPSRGDGAESAPPPDPNGPSIFTALREQLGLKLTATKGPVEILVIDHAEKPAAN